MILVNILLHGGDQNRCYLSVDSIAAMSGLKPRRTKTILASLVDRGLISRREANADKTIPKGRGWVYGLNLELLKSRIEGELSAPSTHKGGELSAPSVTADGVFTAPSGESVDNDETITNQDDDDGGKNHTVQFLPPSRSTSTSTLLLSDGMGSRGSTSRVREATVSTTQPTPSDIELLQAEIVRALEPCDRFYKPNQAIKAVVKQNRSRVRAILAGQGSLEAAIDYIQARGVEWCMRVEHGADYAPPAILKNLAEDAEKGAWVTPKDWVYTLERRIENQVKEQIAGIRKARPGWSDEEYWAKLRAAGEAASRPPVALGAVVRALVPQVDAPVVAAPVPSNSRAADGVAVVRRAPSARAEEPSRPAWWAAVVEAFSDRAVQREAGLEHVGIALVMGLEGARVVASGSIVRVMPGAVLSLGLDALRKHAPTWTAVVTRLAQQRGQQVQVVWTDDETTSIAAPPAPPAPIPEAEPTSVRRTPQGHLQPALPTWWREVGEHLHEAQKRARHHDGDHVWAQVIAQLDRLRERARAADYDPERHELVVEVETLGELREQWEDCAQELARCTALALDLTRRDAPSVRVVELGGVAP